MARHVYCTYEGRLLRYQRPSRLPSGRYEARPVTADEFANDNGDGLFGFVKYALYNEHGGHTGEYEFQYLFVREGA